MARFRDIPEFVRDGSWECNYGPREAIKFIDELITEGLETDPDFQRGHVWTRQQQEDYLEFFFQGGKTARVIYLNHPGWQGSYKFTPGTFVLVDGKQRLQAFRDFYAGKINLFGLPVSKYTDHTDAIRHSLRINMNTLKTRREILEWYLGFNSGGTPHTPQEIARVRKLLGSA